MASSSIFGNLNNTQNKPSLFGSQPSATQSGSSLFGGLSSAKPAQPTTGLFGALSQPSQPQPGGGSLFGSFGATSQSAQPQQTQATTGLFGGQTAASQPAQQQLQTGSMSSSTLQTNSQQQSGFGASTTGQAQNPQSGAYFDSLLEKSRKRAHGETALEELPSLQLGLGDLRQRIRKLGPPVQDRDADGRAHYLLAASGVDPSTAVRDISYFDAQPTRVERTQQSAINDNDVEGYLASLQTQTTLSMIADGLARSVRDFDAFLEDNVTMEWDAQRNRIYQHFGIKQRDRQRTSDGSNGTRSDSAEQGGFGRSRRSKGQPFKSTRAAGASSGSVFGQQSMQRSVIGVPGPIGADQQSPFSDVERKPDSVGGTLGVDVDGQSHREKRSQFAERVQNLNAYRLRKANYPVLGAFAKVQRGDQNVEHIVNAYRCVTSVVDENDDPEGSLESTSRRERQFAKAYLDEAQDSTNVNQMRRSILAGATQHLEKRFFQDLEAQIAKNPREANLGGVPNTTSKVRAYIRLRATNKDLVHENVELQMVNDDYAWALVFFLLRSGHVKEAVDYVAANAAAFRTIDRNFITYITSYHKSTDRRLPRELQDRINNEYNQRVRIAPEHSIDPFRMACYKVIGRCEIEKRDLPGLFNSMEDWVWLQFNLAREVSRIGEIANEAYGLSEVQDTIKNIGARHFSKGGTDQFGAYGVYFYLQVLAGLYEEAVKYLYTFDYIEGVHFAIALNYYGLLRVSDLSAPAGELLTHSTRGLPQINFAYMIGYYTRDFRASNVIAAVDYLVLICLNGDLPGGAGAQQKSQCYEALRELVLESREFAQLLGDVRSDGQRIKGAIEERMGLIGLSDTDDFMRLVTIQAASIADDNGRTTDSVLLYHLAGEYDNVMEIVNRALSEAVAVEIGQDSVSLLPLRPRKDDPIASSQGSSLSLTAVADPVVLAQNMLGLYTTNSSYLRKVSDRNRNACAVLLKMHAVKEKVEKGEWAAALDVSLPGLWHRVLLLTQHSSSSNFTFSPSRPRATLPSSARALRSTRLFHKPWRVTCLP
jgi:nuclear pore complex protein Nup93